MAVPSLSCQLAVCKVGRGCAAVKDTHSTPAGVQQKGHPSVQVMGSAFLWYLLSAFFLASSCSLLTDLALFFKYGLDRVLVFVFCFAWGKKKNS